jgi:hypothetical protein
VTRGARWTLPPRVKLIEVGFNPHLGRSGLLIKPPSQFKAAQNRGLFEQALIGFESGLFGDRRLPGLSLGQQDGQWLYGAGKVWDVFSQPPADAEKSSQILLRSGRGGLEDG